MNRPLEEAIGSCLSKAYDKRRPTLDVPPRIFIGKNNGTSEP